MSQSQGLADLLDASAQHRPGKIALISPNKERVTYSRLSGLADRVRDRLHALGVAPGDRVALHLHKSAAAVAAIFGILKSGAAYVPIDPGCPPERAEYILENSRAKVLISDRALEASARQNLADHNALPTLLTLQESSAESLDDLLSFLQISEPARTVDNRKPAPEDVAYILHTSGSTGKPKGVALTHANALSFIDWCSETFDMRSDDRCSSHAPFHFDLSIFDIFVTIKHGSTLVLIDEALATEIMRLAQVIATEKISVWYSTPSTLTMLASYGKLRLHDYSNLRLVLFAGEPLSVPKYIRLREFWKRPRFFNLYGPTETNVCTWYELPSDKSVAQMPSIPIGTVCPPNREMVVDENDQPASEGELLISGPNVMQGYWNLPEQTTAAFMVDSDQRRWYRTGDIVCRDPDLGLLYIGRRDRMVKRRGYRIELGDIEAALLRMDAIQDAAVIAVPDEESGVKIHAFVTQESNGPSGMALKAATLRTLPRYMIPDEFNVVERIPRTSTNKLDYEHLKRTVAPHP